MSKLNREQHPLLCEDLSEEENFGPLYSRRLRAGSGRGRARTQAKGAANIITHWPDHWTKSATNWWVGLGMITLTVFIVYNSVVAFAFLPGTHSKIIRPTARDGNNSNNNDVLQVFMHILVNPNEEVNVNKYLPYIDILSRKYVGYQYNLYVVLNDTNTETYIRSAEENNDIALNSLWSHENTIKKSKIVKHNNVHINHISLTDYMNESPLMKYWKHLPHHFIGFLMRAVSIWEKGGISFNPTILTPQTPHPIYQEKLDLILQKYQIKTYNGHSHINNATKKHHNKQKDKSKKKVNNIQEIINILESDDDSSNSSQYSLIEAENNNIPTVVRNGRKILSVGNPFNKSNTNKLHHSVTKDIDREITTPVADKMPFHHALDVSKLSNSISENVIIPLDNNKPPKFSLLPLFFEFLFHDKTKYFHRIDSDDKTTTVNSVSRHRKSVIPIEEQSKKINTNIDTENSSLLQIKNDEYKPMIISAKGIVSDSELNKNSINTIVESPEISDNTDQLTIDLKGNILASKTPCHAFLGTVFSNAIHHSDKENLNDFIIAELSVFCKGLLSSCKGIDVILL